MAGLMQTNVPRLAQFLELLNCGAALLHRSGEIVHANRRLCDLCHLPAGSLDGRNLREFYATAADEAQIGTVLAQFDEAREGEFFLPLPDGNRLAVIASGRRLPDQADADFRVVTFIDISPQKRAEENAREQYQTILRLADTLLEQALRFKQTSTDLSEALTAANMDSIYMLAIASEAKDADTGLHVRRIQYCTEALARRAGIPADEAEMIGYSAILHDVGKLLVPDEILKKPASLDDEERRTMELHTTAGESMLPDKPFFRIARQIARSHHENWDGSGYPDGLAGGAIPPAARLVRVVDMFDALRSERVYKPALAENDAAKLVIQASGVAIDPALVAPFAGLLRDGVLQRIREGIDQSAQSGDWTPIRELLGRCAG